MLAFLAHLSANLRRRAEASRAVASQRQPRKNARTHVLNEQESIPCSFYRVNTSAARCCPVHARVRKSELFT